MRDDERIRGCYLVDEKAVIRADEALSFRVRQSATQQAGRIIVASFGCSKACVAIYICGPVDADDYCTP